MWAFIGALCGAAFMSIAGRVWKGRDFLGLAVTFFFFSLLCSDRGTDLATLAAREGMKIAPFVLGFTEWLLAFLVVYVPGIIFVALPTFMRERRESWGYYLKPYGTAQVHRRSKIPNLLRNMLLASATVSRNNTGRHAQTLLNHKALVGEVTGE